MTFDTVSGPVIRNYALCCFISENRVIIPIGQTESPKDPITSLFINLSILCSTKFLIFIWG
jgi:hypothetical protein